MDVCSSSGSPAFSLIATSLLFYLVAVIRCLPGLRAVPAVWFYVCAACAVALLGWLISHQVCEPGLYALARAKLVGLNTVLVVAMGALLAHLRGRGGKR